jgi:hypothetical protein
MWCEVKYILLRRLGIQYDFYTEAEFLYIFNWAPAQHLEFGFPKRKEKETQVCEEKIINTTLHFEERKPLLLCLELNVEK